MHLRSLICIFLILFSLISPVIAADVSDISLENSTNSNNTLTLSSSGSDHEQDQINDAINKVSESGGGTVYLNAGTYELTGTIYIRSNIKLTGDSNAVLIVSSKSSQWFKGSIGIISCKEVIHDVEICGFQINGNCINLDPDLANTPGHNKDCEKCIILHGNSGEYASNIKVYEMQIYDSFSDGMYIYYAKNVQCYNNFISNTQHEGIFWSVVLNGVMSGNKIAGITSDNARLDNCVNCIVKDNVFYSYSGTHTNGAYKHGENGLQVGDAGSSHGYDARKKPTTTQNIEITNNTFANNGLEAIKLGSNSDNNVYIHTNNFIGEKELEQMGIPVEVDVGYIPTVEKSHEVFDSIFDILNIKYTFSGVSTESSTKINYEIKETEMGKIAGGLKIVGFSNTTIIDGKTYISSPEDIIVKSSVIKNPSLQNWFGGISKISKNVTVKIENGTATATMKVTVKWYNYERDRKTGAKQKGKIHYSYYTFNDSCIAPDILQRPQEATGTIYEFKGQGVHHTRVLVNSTGLQRVVYNYDGNTTEHVFLVGEVGSKTVTFHSVDYWNGTLDHYVDSAFINGTFDQSKLNVTAYTVYEEVPVKLNYELDEWDGDSFNDVTIYTSLKLLILLFTLRKLLNIIKH